MISNIVVLRKYKYHIQDDKLTWVAGLLGTRVSSPWGRVVRAPGKGKYWLLYTKHGLLKQNFYLSRGLHLSEVRHWGPHGSCRR